MPWYAMAWAAAGPGISTGHGIPWYAVMWHESAGHAPPEDSGPGKANPPRCYTLLWHAPAFIQPPMGRITHSMVYHGLPFTDPRPALGT